GAHGSSPWAKEMRPPERQFDYLRGNGRREIVLLVLRHEHTRFLRPDRQADPYRPSSARVAAAPSSQPARSRWRRRDFGAPPQLRGDRARGALARDGAEAGPAGPQAPGRARSA